MPRDAVVLINASWWSSALFVCQLTPAACLPACPPPRCRLAYGRKSGYGGYGPPEGWLRGARVIELRMGQDTAVR
jgi:hypothetical protein